ncbi:MAG: EamA family transporter RarD [Spirochaetaceae bacterium]|nr:MAG: EamA family transporter RarD [Spirochaetaceae bacterium]
MKTLSESTVGTLYAAGAFAFWGVLPIYWRLLGAAPAYEILAHRTFWSFAMASLILMATRRRRFLGVLRDRRCRRALILSGLLLGTNWFTFIVAVNAGRVLDASLGYYINPLFSVFLGTVFLKERLSALQKIAVGFAASGVIVLTIGSGVIPWVALILMTTFGLYGLVKKTVAVEPLTALAVETLVLVPVAAIIIGAGIVRGTGALGRLGVATDALLVMAGVVTTVPLYWFAQGARRIPLSRLGFIQYIAPTLMLLVGAVLFGEPFTPVHAVSFSLIWTGLALYSFSHARPRRLELTVTAAGR